MIAIVAIPAKDDYVWKISSEKVPHMTLCVLGDDIPAANLARIADYMAHWAKTSLTRFGLNVSKRGTLGPDQADVVFFHGWGLDSIKEARGYLLQNDAIAQAYASVEQYPEWLPHLTLGYPETPAKPDNRDYPGIGYVSFDRVALWTGDYEGLEVELPEPEDSLSMSDLESDTLAHYGVKGMRWGVRRNLRGGVDKTRDLYKARQESIAKDRAIGISSDAAQAKTSLRIARNASTDRLSNQELQHLVNRMNLEEQYTRLTSGQNKTKSQNVLLEERAKRIVIKAGPTLVGVSSKNEAAKRIGKAIQEDFNPPSQGKKKK